MKTEITREYLETNFKHHHTAMHRGYISRKTDGYAEKYDGRFGHGYIWRSPRWDTNTYHDVDYYIEIDE